VKDDRSPEAAFAEFENRIAGSSDASKRRRVPRGYALRLMIAVSLLIWAAIVLAFIRFFA
jgi:hypothetical protein